DLGELLRLCRIVEVSDAPGGVQRQPRLLAVEADFQAGVLGPDDCAVHRGLPGRGMVLDTASLEGGDAVVLADQSKGGHGFVPFRYPSLTLDLSTSPNGPGTSIPSRNSTTRPRRS